MKKGYKIQTLTKVPGGGTLALTMSGNTIRFEITTTKALPVKEREFLIEDIVEWTGPGGLQPVSVNKGGKTIRCCWKDVEGFPTNLLFQMTESLMTTLGAACSRVAR